MSFIQYLTGIEATKLVVDTTGKVRSVLGDTAEIANNVQDNFFGAVNNAELGLYNVALTVQENVANIAYDTEIRGLNIAADLVERGTMLVYDVIEIVSYLVLLGAVLTIVIILLFHSEIFKLSGLLVTTLGGLSSKYLPGSSGLGSGSIDSQKIEEARNKAAKAVEAFMPVKIETMRQRDIAEKQMKYAVDSAITSSFGSQSGGLLGDIKAAVVGTDTSPKILESVSSEPLKEAIKEDLVKENESKKEEIKEDLAKEIEKEAPLAIDTELDRPLALEHDLMEFTETRPVFEEIPQEPKVIPSGPAIPLPNLSTIIEGPDLKPEQTMVDLESSDSDLKTNVRGRFVKPELKFDSDTTLDTDLYIDPSKYSSGSEKASFIELEEIPSAKKEEMITKVVPGNLQEVSSSEDEIYAGPVAINFNIAQDNIKKVMKKMLVNGYETDPDNRYKIKQYTDNLIKYSEKHGFKTSPVMKLHLEEIADKELQFADQMRHRGLENEYDEYYKSAQRLKERAKKMASSINKSRTMMSEGTLNKHRMDLKHF